MTKPRTHASSARARLIRQARQPWSRARNLLHRDNGYLATVTTTAVALTAALGTGWSLYWVAAMSLYGLDMRGEATIAALAITTATYTQRVAADQTLTRGTSLLRWQAVKIAAATTRVLLRIEQTLWVVAIPVSITWSMQNGRSCLDHLPIQASAVVIWVLVALTRTPAESSGVDA